MVENQSNFVVSSSSVNGSDKLVVDAFPSHLAMTTPKNSIRLETSLESLSIEGNVSSMSPVAIAQPSTKKKIAPEDFKILCVIGQGAFGKVFQVKHASSEKVYAMKIVSKKFLVQKKSVPYMQTERDIMATIKHPFLMELSCAFENDRFVYLVMEYIAGGELFHQLTKQGLLLEDTARFYTAQIVLALEHLHQRGIIHRDLKPENILIDHEGNIRITDFGLARTGISECDDESFSTICGTDEYMAPEMLKGGNYTKAVDFWSLGCLVYEMVVGKPPFRHKNRKKLHEKILQSKLFLPPFLQASTHSFLKGLLNRNVEKRLGNERNSMFQVRGIQKLKRHDFFKGVDWVMLERKQTEAPFKPILETIYDTSNFSSAFTALPNTLSDLVKDDKSPKGDDDSAIKKEEKDLRKLFKKFSYVCEDIADTL